MKTYQAVLGGCALASLLACPSSCPGDDDDSTAGVGSVVAVQRDGFLDIQVDSSRALLAVAATVKLEGATITNAATLGDAAAGKDLFKQNAGDGQVRFAISDSRGLAMKKAGVLVSIPVSGTPTRVQVTDLSAATGDGAGTKVTLTAFDGAPEAR